jgi:hypothetical protein
MLYVFKDESVTIPVDFKFEGDFVSPDEGTYSFKLRSFTGDILYSEDALYVGETGENESGEITLADSVNIEIPAEYNTLEDGKLFETRILEVSYNYLGKPYTIRNSYRVTNFFYFDATPQDVRNYYGLNSGELPDADIDLASSYFQLLQKHGNTFTECLSSGGVGNIRANRLIVLKTVLSVFSSVRLRVNQEENDGSSKFLRYLNKIDWDALYADATAEMEELENNLSGEDTISYTDYTPFALGSVVDAITGEED